MAGSIYDVGIHLAATDGVSGVLASIMKSVLNLHGSVEKLNKGFKAMHLGIMGAATAAAGMGLGHVVKHIVDANAELLRQQNLFKLAGNSAEEMGKATQAAYKSAVAVPNINVAEQFKLYRELAGATQDNDGSMAVLSDVAKAKVVMEKMTGHANESDMMRLFKFVELRQGAIDTENHKIDPEKFKNEVQWATKAIVAGQGMVSSNDLLQFVKQAGPMAKGMTAEDLFGNYLAAMEDMGGARTGTSLTAMGRQMFGGTMSSKIAGEWEKLGLLNKDADGKATGWHHDKKGNTIVDDPKLAMKGYDVLDKQGAVAMVQQVLKPYMEAAGMTKLSDQNKELYKLLGTETARRLGSIALSPEQVNLVRERLKKVMGAEGFDKLFDGGDYGSSVEAFHGAVKTLETSLGDAAKVSPLLMDFAHGISKFANWIQGHPDIAAVATLGGGAASGVLQGGGIVMMGFAARRLIRAAGALERAATIMSKGVPGVSTPSPVPIGPVAAPIVPGAAPGTLASTMGPRVAAIVDGLAGSAFIGMIYGLGKLIGASYNAQQPGGGGMYAQPTDATRDSDRARLADMKGELATVERQIADIKGKNKLPEMLPTALGNLPDRAQELKNAVQLLENELTKLGPAGQKAGADAVKGFSSADFAWAGTQAGQAVVKALNSALAGIKIPSLGAPAAATAPAAASAPGKQSSLVPPAMNHTSHITFVATLDGRAVMRNTVRHIMADNTHVAGPNFHDSSAGFEPVDYVPA